MSNTKRSVGLFVGGLTVVLVAVLATILRGASSFDSDWLVWIGLSVLLAATEYAQVYFHDEGARFGLTGSESVLTVMVTALSLPQVVIGAMVAICVERTLRRTAGLKVAFNVVQYGLSAAAAGGVWAVLAEPSAGFTVWNAIVATAAVLIFAILTHFLTSIVIALVEERPILELSRSVASATVLNLAGSVVLGLLFAAAYKSAQWTLLLFPLPILGLYLGYTAVLRTQQERDRVEHLYAATRALASSRNADESIIEFLRAVAEIVSAPDARLVLRTGTTDELWIVQRGAVSALRRRVSGDVHSRLLNLVGAGDGSVLMGEADETVGSSAEILRALETKTLMATPLMANGSVVGCLITVGRVGAEDFSSSDARLLEALANELVVSLETYRLFAQVLEERERFGRIFAGSKEGICLLDADGTVSAWNPALERITGHPATEVMGRAWSDAVVIRDKREGRLSGDQLVGVEPDEELELVTKAGPSRWITTVSGRVGESEGGGWVVLVRDVTAEHEVEAAKSDFLSTISHELRTPLTTIKGSLQVLSRGRENLPPALADKMIGVTTRGAERLERLVMNLLAVSQIESGTMPVFPDELALGEIVQERVAVMLKDHDRTTVTLPQKAVVVRADRERLSQAIEHLLENALNFGGPGGEITIELARENGYARLSVADEGPGIATAEYERIFERFVRLGDVLTRETQGAGVGLFIAARSVQAMGGEIWVESTVGKGSTFYVTVPLAHPVAVEDTA